VGATCWFCWKKFGDKEVDEFLGFDVLFSTEFDTYFHRTCLYEALKKNPENFEEALVYEEANIIANECYLIAKME